MWVWEAAEHAFVPSSIHMLLCKEMLTSPCCPSDTGHNGHRFGAITTSGTLICSWGAFSSRSSATSPSAAPACPGGSTGTSRPGYHCIHYNNLFLEVWNYSSILRIKEQNTGSSERISALQFEICGWEQFNIIYMSFYSKSFEQRTLNKISILIRRKHNHQCCGKQSWQYQCDNYFKKINKTCSVCLTDLIAGCFSYTGVADSVVIRLMVCPCHLARFIWCGENRR